MQKLFRSLIAVGGLAGLVACGDDVSIAGPGLAISGAPVTAISVGAKVQLSANEAVSWASSAANVASVDATGLVTAVAAGTASITATSTANPDRKASVTITVSSAVRNVTVSPPNAVLLPGGSLGFVANVDADAGVARTVTWSSSNTAVATVTSAGVVTAVTPGSATITAASTVAPTVSGSAVVTVRQPTPATISVQNITIAGTNNVTANVNNIAGSIDVNMNVDPGEQVVQRVEVLIDGQVACTQNLSPAQSESMRIAAAFDDIEDVIVSCQVNTAAFAAATGVANFFNGPHTLSVRAVIAGGNDVATPTTPLIFNNLSGVIATMTNNNGSDPASAIDPRTGLQWIGGAATVSFTGVSYVTGTTVATVSCNIFGKDLRTFTLTNGTGSQAYAEGTSPWSQTDTDVAGYMTANQTAGEFIICGSATLSNGSPMATTNGSVLLNYSTTPLTQNTTNAAMPALQVFRMDNVAPGATAANPTAPAQAALALGAITNPWVTSATSLLPGSTSTNRIGVPPTSTLNATLTAGAEVEEGVDAVTVEVWATAAGAALPGTTAACSTTGLTSITTGSQLAETTVSTAYTLRIVFKDALGNRVCLDQATTIGADFTAPTFTGVTGPAANTGSPAPGSFTVQNPLDNASGFSGTPLQVKIVMDSINAAGTVSSGVCITGSGSSCSLTATANPVASVGANQGYYTATIRLSDQAGNTVEVFTDRLYLFDAVAPAFSGGISLPSVIAGGATNVFQAAVTDNRDLASIFGAVTYANGNLVYPSQSIGTFGVPFERSVNVSYSVANWIRCLNVAGDFASTGTQPSNIVLGVVDFASNAASATSGAFGTNAQACNGVGNVAINFFGNSATTNLVATFPAGFNTVDIDGVTLGATSVTSVLLTAVAEVPLNTAADPFARVDVYYQHPVSLLWVKVGTATATLAQSPTIRTYTYNFTWDPDASVPPNAALAVRMLGVDAQGDAVWTNQIPLNIVP